MATLGTKSYTSASIEDSHLYDLGRVINEE